MIAMLIIQPATAQSIPDTAASDMDKMRSLEIEISQLEKQLSEAMAKMAENIQRLQEIEIKINESYIKMDQNEAELADIKKSMDKKIRQLYVVGRRDSLIDVLCTDNVTDFIVSVDRMVNLTDEQSRLIEELKDKRSELEESQNRLLGLKDYYAQLSRSTDVDILQGQLTQKREELAAITADLIQSELPATYSPQSNEFKPASVYQQPDENGFVKTGQVISGYSSWYGNEFHGRPTANGETFDQYALTCAHKTLPFGTWLKVTFKGRSVICRVNDRGPFVKGRILDLSRGSAEAIGLSGVQWVDCEIVVPK